MLKFYCLPWSRASGVFWLLEELGRPYQIELVDTRSPGGVPESYRAIQPNKKVPAIDHDGTVVTERAAICIYLADAFPEARLAPAIGDKRRAAYLTRLVYCDSVFDPAVAARAQGLEYTGNSFSFGLFEDMVANLEKLLAAEPYAVGDSFTAADTQLASGIHFTMNILNVLPKLPVFEQYLARATDRPAYRSYQAKEAELARQVTPIQFRR
ncbi:glutathione S-transferase family protein [Mesorhizobium sp. SP-1A]|uniref:glutathione S-transferase family protein n=1 Tax=Mesorhizobium sp. SP-1A TaxID=3077840 RepID=UPI0028F71292|nr:glutathione S-transferase family protein [Mesorhizobium sp. SP-1A]